jgi:hypothetical protein
MTQEIKDMWAEAEKEVDASLADSTPTDESDSNNEVASDDSSADASAPPEGHEDGADPRDDLDFNNPDDVASYLQDNPDDAADVLKQFQRHLDGKRGTEIRNTQALEATLADLQNKVNMLQQPQQTTTDPNEPDEYGLTPAQYKQLKPILEKAMGEETKVTTQAVQQLMAQQQLNAVWDAAKKEYGQAFTPKRQNRIERLLRKSGYNWNDPDVIAECQEVKTEIETEQRDSRSRKVRQEQNSRSDATRRSRASSDPALTSFAPSNADDIKVTDDKGNLSIAEMIKSAEKISRQLDRR